MFQTFSGNSRRPRQVNLSGQNANPFAASSWTPSAGFGAQQTVAAAQQERQVRKMERDRLNGAKRIQRTWRGHRVRRELAESRRRAFDEIEEGGGSFIGVESTLADLLRLLVAFFNSKRSDDIKRLAIFSSRVFHAGYQAFLPTKDVQPYLRKLANTTLAALEASLPHYPDVILQLLVALANYTPGAFTSLYGRYYRYLKILSFGTGGTKPRPTGLKHELVLAAITTPLAEPNISELNDEKRLCAYSAFALEFLTNPELSNSAETLAYLAGKVEFDLLSVVLVQEFSSVEAGNIQPEGKLRLLGHFIALHRLQKQSKLDPAFLRALSLQLSSSSSIIMDSIFLPNLEGVQDGADDDVEPAKNTPAPLHSFIKEQLLSLVDQVSITGLLSKFNLVQGKDSALVDEDASLLSSYALTLLRMFPSRGDEIRMWLFQGSISTQAGDQIPALHFFWRAVTSTNTYLTIRDNSKAALPLLLPQTNSEKLDSTDMIRDREWRTILLFLELYNFVLRFTDDEEFLSADNPNLDNKSLSRFGESALPLQDITRLTSFLKNVAFTAYFNASDLLDDDQNLGIMATGGLGTYFGMPTTSRSSKNHRSNTESRIYRPFAGIAGMKFSYVRTIVTGVTRMLYERDSRRRFLPKHHWLMTSRFDMDGFIPAVVSEEERRQEYQEEDQDDEEDPVDANPTLVGMESSRRAQHIELLRRQQQAAAHSRYMVQVGPRLEVLQNMPFAIPFETRVQIFRQFVYLDQVKRRGGDVDPDIWRMNMVRNAMLANPPPVHLPGREVLSRHHAKIRRDQLFEDAFDAFFPLGEGLKEPIQITFVDQFDTAEAGIDGGGVTKEFLTSVTNEAFRSEDGPNLFVANEQNLLYPNPATLDERRELMKSAGFKPSSQYWRDTIKHTLEQYEFLGRVVGKCLYEGILVDVGFAGFFLLKWATAGAATLESGYRPNINDLRDFDEGLYQGLLQLKNYAGNVEDFSLDFTIQDTYSLPGSPTQTITRELVPNGANETVTNENRPIYVSYVARHRLLIQPFQQTQAFLKGLSSIIKPSWLSMFNQVELQTLIGGDSSEINVEDLRKNTIYGGVYQLGDDGEHSTVRLFWKVMQELDDEDRRKVLKYVTSTPRAPLLGFSQLNPRFSIRDAGGDEERLPSTSTCVNLLKLPRYSTAKVLRSKLLYAVNSGAGFDLS